MNPSSYRETRYRAERVDSVCDGKHVRLVREPVGPLAPELPQKIIRLREDEARELRDSLDEVLDD